MPRIFAKNCKINIIEYGNTGGNALPQSWTSFRRKVFTRLRALFRF
jgi:hypothetical protein